MINLGDGLLAAGKKDEAETAYHKALKIYPNFKPSKKKLKS